MAKEAAVAPPVPPGAPPLEADLAAVGKSACTWCGSAEREPFRGERCNWYRCRQCGFWVSELLVDPEVYATEDYGADYQHSYYGRSIARKLKTSYYRWNVIEAVKPGPGSFLDVGCSYGTMLKAGAERGWSTHGVDIAPAMIDYAKTVGQDVRLGSLTKIPYDDDTFDVIHARHVLEHDIQTYAALAELRRVMKPGGILVVEVPDGDCARTRRNPAAEVPNWSYLHMVTFTPTTLAGFMARSGWQYVPPPTRIAGGLQCQGWFAWKSFRERRRWATYFITYWRKA
ncbi:MAG: class I SAM-dependent methyltransferase [Fimbriimonadaceae bacterium]|nr:class I SAM-dependent methyltransferase [Fimbriimonadaceae bacterium]